MALDTAPLVWEQSNLAFKLESTTGTPNNPSAAEGILNVFNADMKYSSEKVERPGQGSLSPIRQGTGARGSRSTFESEAFGGGGAAGTLGTLLQMCGTLASGTTYKPLTRPQKTGTIALWRSGRCKRQSGSMGNSVWTFARGKAPRIRWDLMGVAQPPGDLSQITPNYLDTIAPESVVTFTIGGSVYIAPELVFDQGNIVVMREDLEAKDEDGRKTGYRNATITGRRPTFKVAPDALPLSSKDWYEVFMSRETVAIEITCNDDEGNGVTVSADTLELDGDPEDLNRNGILADSLTFLATRTTDAGDDEYTIDLHSAEA